MFSVITLAHHKHYHRLSVVLNRIRNPQWAIINRFDSIGEFVQFVPQLDCCFGGLSHWFMFYFRRLSIATMPNSRGDLAAPSALKQFEVCCSLCSIC